MGYKEIISKRLLELAKKDENGELYIEEKEIDDFSLSEEDKTLLLNILKENNIKVKKYMIEPKDRTTLVSNYDFGEDPEERQVPRFSKLEYDELGNLIFEDYEAFDEYIENEFIPNNITYKKRPKRIDSTGRIYPIISNKAIQKLRISDKERIHLMEYLDKAGIIVRGTGQSNDEFENFDYWTTYKNIDFKNCNSLPQNVLESKFIQYNSTHDPKIREEIIVSNVKLAKWISYKYSMIYDIPQEILLSYAFEGLIKAVDIYSVNKGYKFSSFAIACMKNEMRKGRGIESSKIIYMNPNWISNYLNCKRIVQEVSPNLEGQELAEEVSLLMIRRGYVSNNLYSDNVKQIIAYENIESIDDLHTDKNLHMDKDLDYKIDYMEEYNSNTEEEDALILEGLYYPNVDQEGKIINKVLSEKIEMVLKTLTPREEIVLSMRFGFDPYEGPMSLEEVARKFNVTRERVRQIEAKALRKLRHPSRAMHIRDLSTSEEYDDDLPPNINIYK